ncbi:hypothetical protein GQX74_002030 [Glossina fuscipes]|nr:hypothetical protein GQX74_002030 [Glossina fuscipes]
MENLPLRCPSFVHILGHLFLKFHSLSKRFEPVCTNQLNIQPFVQPMASHHPKLKIAQFDDKGSNVEKTYFINSVIVVVSVSINCATAFLIKISMVLNWHHFLPKHCSGTPEIWADPIAAAIVLSTNVNNLKTLRQNNIHKHTKSRFVDMKIVRAEKDEADMILALRRDE